MNTYLFVLGRNPALSRAELSFWGEEVLYDAEKSLCLMENLRFENPRNLPKTKEQLFLDRLGGVIRFGVVLGEFKTEKELQTQILKTIETEKPEGKVHLGVSAWGSGRHFIKPFLGDLKESLKAVGRNCRLINISGDNLDSGKIFGERLLQKGFEFIIWKKGDSYLLVKTVASQNLRNYTLRDREKEFRDSKMGMLPPKVAQILINIANPSINQIIIDPFCGSGTLNIEAALSGYKTVGSDIVEKHVKESQKNCAYMSEKFRYDGENHTFIHADATQFPYARYENAVVVTEGSLGENFERRPQKSVVEKEMQIIQSLWKRVFVALESSTVQTVVFCLPAWKLFGETVSISESVLRDAEKRGFEVERITEKDKTYIYARPDAFVGREICKVVRKK